MRLVDGDPPPTAAVDELEAHPALPDPGVTEDANDLPVRGDRLLQDRREPRELVVPPHETREAPPARGIEAGAQRSDPTELVDRYRRADALHGPRAMIVQGEEALDEPRRVLRQVDRSRLRRL